MDRTWRRRGLAVVRPEARRRAQLPKLERHGVLTRLENVLQARGVAFTALAWRWSAERVGDLCVVRSAALDESTQQRQAAAST